MTWHQLNQPDKHQAAAYFQEYARKKERMSEAELMHSCEVCYKQFAESELVEVEEIKHSRKRVFPWHICQECAEKVSSALKCKNAEQSKPLTDKQKEYIKLYLGEEYGQCTEGYFMTRLGLANWQEAEKLIEQYEREGKHE